MTQELKKQVLLELNTPTALTGRLYPNTIGLVEEINRINSKGGLFGQLGFPIRGAMSRKQLQEQYRQPVASTQADHKVTNLTIDLVEGIACLVGDVEVYDPKLAERLEKGQLTFGFRGLTVDNSNEVIEIVSFDMVNLEDVRIMVALCNLGENEPGNLGGDSSLVPVNTGVELQEVLNRYNSTEATSSHEVEYDGRRVVMVGPLQLNMKDLNKPVIEAEVFCDNKTADGIRKGELAFRLSYFYKENFTNKDGSKIYCEITDVRSVLINNLKANGDMTFNITNNPIYDPSK